MTEALKKPATIGRSEAGIYQNYSYDNSVTFPRLIVNGNDHLKFLHEDSYPGAFANIYHPGAKQGERRYYSRRVDGLDDWEIPNDLGGREDVYVAINPLFIPYRKNQNVSDIRWLYVDIDAPRIGQARADWAFDTTIRIEQEIIDRGILPRPNARVSSGTGIWLLWKIEKLSTQHPPSVKSWKSFMKEFSDVLKPYGADKSIGDPARLMRLAGTINSRSGQKVTIVVDHDHTYNLQELKERYFPAVLLPDGGKHPDKKPEARENAKKAPGSHGKNLGTLAVDRMKDIETIVALRDGEMDGHRNNALYIYAYHGAWLFDMDDGEVEQRVIELNEIFTNPLPMRDVITIIRSAQRRPQGYLFDSNESIINKLDITDEEQRELKTIIGNEEYRRRDRERKREKRRAQGMRTKAQAEADRLKEQMAKVSALKKAIKENPNATNAELAGILGCSLATLKRWKSRL